MRGSRATPAAHRGRGGPRRRATAPPPPPRWRTGPRLRRPRPDAAEEISEEILLVISAAVAAFLGERAHIRQVRLLALAGLGAAGPRLGHGVAPVGGASVRELNGELA